MTGDEQIIERYLLGELPEGERSALEREYFDDRELFDRIVRAESDLVDKYARGLLPPATRERFETYYLAHPARRERARFAEALAARLDRSDEIPAAPPAHTEAVWLRWLSALRGPRLGWALPAALLLTAVTAVWLFIESRPARRELAQTDPARAAQEPREPQQVVRERAASAQPSAEPVETHTGRPAAPPPPTPPAKSAPAFASLVITVGGTRSADAAPPAVLIITAPAQHARLRLNLRESDYTRYRAVLRAAGGGEVYAWRSLAPRAARSGASLDLTLPARKLAAGDYILTLQGVAGTGEVEDVSKSLFRVERR